MISIQDRFRGCLIGGAIGDALGYPVEFMTCAEIQRWQIRHVAYHAYAVETRLEVRYGGLDAIPVKEANA